MASVSALSFLKSRLFLKSRFVKSRLYCICLNIRVYYEVVMIEFRIFINGNVVNKRVVRIKRPKWVP